MDSKRPGEWGMGTPAEIADFQGRCEHFLVYMKGGRICLGCKKIEDLPAHARRFD